MEFTAFQKKALGFLRTAIKKGRVSHFYLFLGKRGVGRKEVALWFSKALNCKEGMGEVCGRCSNCMKIEKEVFSDVIYIEPLEKSLRIQQIRELSSMLSYPPLEGRFRTVIVEEAESLTEEASNAFLKILEEPSPYNIFILICQKKELLLPTIVSRAQSVYLSDISEGSIKSYLIWEGVSESDAAFISRICQGSIKDALDLIERGVSKKRERFLRILLDLKEGSLRDIFRLIEDLSKKSRKGDDLELDDMIIIWKSFLRDMMFCRLGFEDYMLINHDLFHIFKKLSQGFSVDDIISIIRLLDQFLRDMDQQRNTEISMERAIFGIRELIGKI